MSLMRPLKKLKYYTDIRLTLHILLASLKVSTMFYFQKNKRLIGLANPKRLERRCGDEEKIARYVNLCLYLRGQLGLKDTCLTQSILLCHMFRKYGIDAKLNFGTQRNEETEIKDLAPIGHCWVTIGQEDVPGTYQFIYRYP